MTLLVLGPPGCGRENEFVAPPPPKVTVQAPVQREVTTFTEFTSRLEAVETVHIRARVSGFLETIDFTPSQIVDEGDLLFTIESAPYEATRDAAIAEAGRRTAAVNLADVTLQRIRGAMEAGAVSEIELLEAEANLEEAQAALESANAAIRAAEIDVEYTRILAPMGGRVSRNLVSIGNLVGAGEATHLTTIVLDDPIYAYFTASERDLLKYLESRPGPETQNDQRKPIQFELSDGSAYEHVGTVDFADNRVDTLTGSLQIRAEFKNPDAKLFPGLFARVKIPVESGPRLLVPGSAIQRDIDGSFLLLADAQSQVIRRNVEVGQRVGPLRVISSGLDGTERVIVAGLQRARPGSTVQAQNADTGDGGA